MSKLKKLIEMLCPEGVEYKPLWQLTAWDKNFNGIEKSMQKKIIKYPYVLAKVFDELETEHGDVKLLSTGISDKERWTTEEIAGDLVCEGEIVAIPWGGTPNVKYYKGKFVTADNRIATSLDTTILNNKYLYYYLCHIIEDIAALYRGAGIQHPSMKGVLTLEIPVPPLAVQEEIVRILDKFTMLEAELEAELEARKRQYEYYRNQLLSFNQVGGASYEVKWMKMGEITDILRGRRLTKKELTADAQYPVFHGGIEPIGYYTQYNRPANTVMIINVGASAGTVGFSKEDFWSSDGCFCVGKSEKFDDKFLFYLLSKNQHSFVTKVRHAGIPTLDSKVIADYVIPVPPLCEQLRIVAILDRFESLTTDLQIGLPAEIAARRKQYEYYREQLLTFKRKAA